MTDGTRSVVVDGDGAVTLPLVGKVKAEGLTISQFTRRIEDALTPYIARPEVTTFVEKMATAVPAKSQN
jgi:protein involved in polysaccharide export with SLBB domain